MSFLFCGCVNYVIPKSHNPGGNLITVLETLSTHSPEEEYLGERPNENWITDVHLKDLFGKSSDCHVLAYLPLPANARKS